MASKGQTEPHRKGCRQVCRRGCDLKVAKMSCTVLHWGPGGIWENPDKVAADDHAVVGRLVLASLQLGLPGRVRPEGNGQAAYLPCTVRPLKAPNNSTPVCF